MKMRRDYSHIPENTDAEEAEIQRQIASNPDAAELTEEQAAQGPMTFAEVMQSVRGRPKKPGGALMAVTLRLPPEIVERYKSEGRDWRTRMAKRIE